MAAGVIKRTVEGKPVESDAQKRGRVTGAQGGTARASKMTPAQRSEAARKAAKARWAKRNVA